MVVACSFSDHSQVERRIRGGGVSQRLNWVPTPCSRLAAGTTGLSLTAAAGAGNAVVLRALSWRWRSDGDYLEGEVRLELAGIIRLDWSGTMLFSRKDSSSGRQLQRGSP